MLMIDDNDDDDDDDDNDDDDDDDNCLHYNALRIIASLEVPSYPDRLAHCSFARSEHVGLETLHVYRMTEAGSEHVSLTALHLDRMSYSLSYLHASHRLA